MSFTLLLIPLVRYTDSLLSSTLLLSVWLVVSSSSFPFIYSVICLNRCPVNLRFNRYPLESLSCSLATHSPQQISVILFRLHNTSAIRSCCHQFEKLLFANVSSICYSCHEYAHWPSIRSNSSACSDLSIPAPTGLNNNQGFSTVFFMNRYGGKHYCW